LYLSGLLLKIVNYSKKSFKNFKNFVPVGRLLEAELGRLGGPGAVQLLDKLPVLPARKLDVPPGGQVIKIS